MKAQFRSQLLVATAILFCTLISIQAQDLSGQRIPVSDPGNGLITGRITLPSGFSVSSNIRVMLSKTEAQLMTIYSNKTGEFTFSNLRAGLYFVHILADDKLYEPVVKEVRITPGGQAFLVIPLNEKIAPTAKTKPGGVVSVSEAENQIPLAARKEYDKAAKLAKKGELQNAILGFQQALSLYPDYLAAHNDLGVQYLRLKRFDEAASEFEMVLEKSPKFFNARLNLGIVRVEQHHYREAIDHLTQAIAADSSNPAAHLFLGIAALDTDDLPIAEKELVRALLLGGNDYAIAHYYFAHVYLKSGRREEAARELKLYLASAPAGETAMHAKVMVEQMNLK